MKVSLSESFATNQPGLKGQSSRTGMVAGAETVGIK